MALEFSTLRIGTDNYDLKDLRARQQVEELEGKVDKELVTNLLNPTLKGSTTINGVTCVANGDGTYTLNGTATAEATFNIIPWGSTDRVFKGYQFRFFGCPEGGSSTTYRLQMTDKNNGTNRWFQDIGNGSIIDTIDGELIVAVFRIDILKDCTCDNLTFKPMLTTNLEATIDDFVPYTGSTGKLNSDLAEVKAEVSDLTQTVANKADNTRVNDVYRAVKGMIATIETTSTASQPYTVGQYLTYNGQLREVTSAIAQGDTISNSNTKVTNVGTEIQQINADLSDISNTIGNTAITFYTTTDANGNIRVSDISEINTIPRYRFISFTCISANAITIIPYIDQNLNELYLHPKSIYGWTDLPNANIYVECIVSKA